MMRATLFLAVLATTVSSARQAAAVTYDPFDSSMAYLTLAEAPTLLGPTDDHPGMWEYVYDFYHAAGTFENYVELSGVTADSIVNLHDLGSGLGLYQRWDGHAAGGWVGWGGFWDKSIRPSYYNGGGGVNPEDFYELPSSGACVGCENVAYEYLNRWHNPFEYNNAEIFYSNTPGALADSDGGIAGNDTVRFDVWNPSGPNQFTAGGLGLTFRVVHPNEPTTVSWSTSSWNGQAIEGTIAGPGQEAVGCCVLGDVDCDCDVDIDDILIVFPNFTGPGSHGKTRKQGDVEGGHLPPFPFDPCPYKYDGDVDVADILTIFGAFTGPLDEAGLVGAAEAGDPSVPDLIYDPATGEVILSADGSAIIGYSLKSAGAFLAGGHTPILGGVSTSLSTELAEAALSSSDGSIGFVLPTGLDLAALMALLSENTVSTGLGAPLVPFDLVVLGPAVPEPAAVMLTAVALLGLAAMGARRRKRAVIDEGISA